MALSDINGTRGFGPLKAQFSSVGECQGSDVGVSALVGNTLKKQWEAEGIGGLRRGNQETE